MLLASAGVSAQRLVSRITHDYVHGEGPVHEEATFSYDHLGRLVSSHSSGNPGYIGQTMDESVSYSPDGSQMTVNLSLQYEEKYEFAYNVQTVYELVDGRIVSFTSRVSSLNEYDLDLATGSVEYDGQGHVVKAAATTHDQYSGENYTEEDRYFWSGNDLTSSERWHADKLAKKCVFTPCTTATTDNRLLRMLFGGLCEDNTAKELGTIELVMYYNMGDAAPGLLTESVYTGKNYTTTLRYEYECDANGDIVTVLTYRDGKAESVYRVDWQDGASIDGIAVHDNTREVWHSLDGRRVAHPATKGIYVKDGRKVVVR